MEDLKIKDGALIECHAFAKGDIVIPDGVTRIESRAFYQCTRLTSVTIPDSVTYIGKWAFSGCTNLTSITISNSVTSIGSRAFSDCTGLTSVTIGNSVTSIGDYAFYNCNKLTSVTIPNSVTSIRNSAFENCYGLTSVSIGNSVASIEGWAFSGCTNLTSVTIPNSVTSIGIGAFADCPNLTPKRNNVLPDGRIVAYKAFYWNMTCRYFRYEEGETYEIDGEIKLCLRGFHACLNPFDVFNYYYGELGKGIVIHEVYLEGVSNKRAADSKVVCRKITIGKRLTLEDMCKTF